MSRTEISSMSQKRLPLPLFRTILFATDLSQSSRLAFKVGCSLARAEATRMILFHVEQPARAIGEPIDLGTLGIPIIISDEELVKHDILSEIRQLYVPNAPIELEYRVGRG